MNMFEGVGFENFKIFKDKTYFELAPITILTGTNNSGKSSLLNGIRLLKENFKDFVVQNTWAPVDSINLESIMTTTFEPGSLMERYGPLQSFVSKNGPVEKQMKFHFKRKMAFINEEMEIILNIQIMEDNIKMGFIKNLIIQTVNTGKVIFEIKDVRDSKTAVLGKYIINLDLYFFYEKQIERITKSLDFYKELNELEVKIDESKLSDEEGISLYKAFSEKHKVKYEVYIEDNLGISNLEYHLILNPKSYILEKPLLHSIIDDNISFDVLYDFSFLWADDPGTWNQFADMLNKFYNGSFRSQQLQLNTDIIKFLAKVEWQWSDGPFFPGPGINNMINKSHASPGIGLKRFTEFFTNFGMHPTAIATFTGGNLSIIEEGLSKAIKHNKRFFQDIFKPLLSLVAPNLPDGEQQKLTRGEVGPFDNIRATNLEENVLQLILENLKVVEFVLGELKEVNFLPTNKIQHKRTYSFFDNNDFTLLIRKFEQLETKTKSKAEKFINNWLKEFGVADSFQIKHDMDTSNFKIYLVNGGEEILMADFGYGTSQLLPLLLKLIPEQNPDHKIVPDLEHPFMPRTVIIEEPETNLHPALQSKLADLFVEANQKFNIQILVETHSEYLIRKLQYLTAKGNLSAGDTQIYYFYHPDKVPPGQEQVQKIIINNDGALSNDFGTGFFDESDNIAMSLWSMNASQKN